MHGEADRSGTGTLCRSAAGALGLRRLDWVRVVVGDGPTTCEVVGSGHRGVQTRRVSLATALRLRAGGVPTVVRSTEPRPATAPAAPAATVPPPGARVG